MDCRKTLQTLAFDNAAMQWTPTQLDSEATSTGMVETLNLVTYNVWHDNATLEERSTDILNILSQTSADFICLQELTKPLLLKLMNTEWVQQEYYIPEISIENYTTLILSKLPCHFYIKKWPTRMDRSLLYAELEINGVLTAVANVHLESLANSRYRKKQLDITFEELSLYPKCFVLGDFNFDWATENKNIASNYVDIWPYLNSGTSGCTVQKTHDFIAWRPDRILMKKNGKYKPIAVDRFGTEPLARFRDNSSNKINSPKQEEFIIQTPSNHFGLKMVVEFLDNGKEEWVLCRERVREKNYRETKKEKFVWIDGTKRGHENPFYLEEIEKIIKEKKATMKSFDKVDEGVEDLLAKLNDCDDLTLIVSLPALHEILYSWKKELKVIQDKFVHEKHFRFRVIILTGRHNYVNGVQLCRNAGFEKYFVFTKFSDVVNSLSVEQ